MNKISKTKSSFFTVILFGLIACVLYGVGAGLRTDIGILLNPLALHCHIKYADVSMSIAVMQLVFGASQPVFGIIASKKSNRHVLLIGVILLILSMIGMILSDSFIDLLLTLGVIFGLSVGALSFGLILTSAINYVGEDNAMIISGILNAAAGLLGFILSPTLQAILDIGGVTATLSVLSIVSIILVPVVYIVTSRDDTVTDSMDETVDFHVFKEAFTSSTFRLLFIGFGTCGFHMVIIESHLFSQFILYGLNTMLSSWAFAIYGIATIIGALLSGYLSNQLHKGRLLAGYYGFRAMWVIIYIWLLPKTMLTAVLFAIGLGLTGDATVTPTFGLVNDSFKISKTATVMGMLFFIHQVGAFLSAWLGGIIRQVFGGYTLIWIIDVIVCVIACIVSLKIRKTTTDKI